MYTHIYIYACVHLTSDGDASSATRSSCSPDIIRNLIRSGRLRAQRRRTTTPAAAVAAARPLKKKRKKRKGV